MEQQAIQTLPHNQDAERSVLGSMLLEVNALDAMLEQLQPEDFYDPEHKHIFEAMRKLRQDGDSVDIVTLSGALERSGKLESSGGLVYLTELMKFVPSAANVQHYERIVEEHSIQRALIRVVRSPEGEISLDFRGKKPGRGAYVCPNAECLKRARKSRALERAFSAQIPAEVYEKLQEQMEAGQ